MMGTYVFTIMRAMIANCVPASEIGKVYAMWSSLNNFIPVAVQQIYKEIWTVRKCVTCVYLKISQPFTARDHLFVCCLFIVQG